MDKPFTILPDAPAMPGAKASPFYVQKEKKGEQKSYRTITHWHDELECLTILDGTLDFQLNESVISLQKGSTLIVLPGAIHRNLTKPEDTVFMRILANPALLTANEEIREKLVRPLLQNASREYFYIPAGFQGQQGAGSAFPHGGSHPHASLLPLPFIPSDAECAPAASAARFSRFTWEARRSTS